MAAQANDDVERSEETEEWQRVLTCRANAGAGLNQYDEKVFLAEIEAPHFVM